MSVNVLTQAEHGKPEDVVRLSVYELPSVGEGQVLVDVKFAPINPADLNMMEGKYNVQPELPSVLGNEGVGVVSQVGDGVENISVGDHVILPFRTQDDWIGMWAESLLARAEDVMVIPKGIPLEQASMLTVNPVTAYQLLTLFDSLSPGDTIVQNAGNSGVGRWVIALAKSMGVQTINLVRRESLIDELKALGADWVLVDEEGVSKKVKEISGDVRLAFNAVGGQSAIELMKSLTAQGVMVTYGAMSKEPVSVSNGQLIYKNIWVTGFNRSNWVDESPREVVSDAYDAVIKAYMDTPIEVPVEATYGFDEVEKALQHAAQSERSGKILFQVN